MASTQSVKDAACRRTDGTTMERGEVRIEIARNMKTAVLGIPIRPFETSELIWSDGREEPERVFSAAEHTRLMEGMKLSEARRCHLSLVASRPGKAGTVVTDGALIGSGVAVQYRGRYGVLTARHVMYDGEHERHRDKAVGFMPSPSVFQRSVRGTAHGGGASQMYCFVPPDEHEAPPEGLPDLALIVFADDSLPERIALDQKAEDTETEWLDLADHSRVGIEVSDDEMLRKGAWLLTAARGEPSRPGFIRSDNVLGPVVSRVYKRGPHEYYGMLRATVGGPRSEELSLKGASGCGLWRQSLTKKGVSNLRGTLSEPVRRDDLTQPVLAGIAFYDEELKRPKLSQGQWFKRETYAHRLTPAIVDCVKRALTGELGELVSDEPITRP